MGVIDQEYKRLQDVVTSLEKRVEQLEQRQSGNVKSTDGVRMVLMGPPGAGTS
jgi:adenylate kinase